HGLFNVMLGSLSSIPKAVIADNANLYLGIAIGADVEMTPRVQLGSVPYATQALTVPDASITTTKIADGAVTQVTQVTNDDYVDMTTNGPLKDMSVTMTTTGKPVLILFSTRWGHDTTGQRFCYTLERNNTAIAQSCDSDGGDIWGANTALSLTWLDVPPAGTHTYRIFIQMQGGTIHFKNRQMQIVELKK
ncbi:MAG: hypothetical protein KDE58_33310, partial [Caldilineaceae bacterium]|nr:hypothetical protein [Caldilineaceae bacterium]